MTEKKEFWNAYYLYNECSNCLDRFRIEYGVNSWNKNNIEIRKIYRKLKKRLDRRYETMRNIEASLGM